MKKMMVLLAAVALAAPAAVAQEAGTNNGRSLTTLARIPLKTRDGAHIRLASRVGQGKPTLIAIWASWCGPCYGEAPYLNQLRKDLGGSYNFIYVNRRFGNPDPDQPPEAIARFLAFGGMSDVDYVVADIPAYRQILGTDVGTIPDGKAGIPRVYLFDRRGKQIYATYGFGQLDGIELQERVKQAVAER